MESHFLQEIIDPLDILNDKHEGIETTQRFAEGIKTLILVTIILRQNKHGNQFHLRMELRKLFVVNCQSKIYSHQIQIVQA